MKLWHQIAALAVLAAALPLATVGFALVRWNQRALEAEVCGRFDQTARHAAEAVAAEVDGRAHLLARTVQAVPWKSLSPDEARGALTLVAGEAGGTRAVLFQPGEAGRPRELAHIGDGNPGGDLLPRASARGSTAAGDVTLSAVFADGEGRPLTVAATSAGQRGDDPLVVAVEMPLQQVWARLDGVRSGAPLALTLVDRAGEAIADSPRKLPIGARPDSAALEDLRRGGDGSARRLLSPDGRAELAAHAEVGGLGWAVLVEEDAELALAAPRRMRDLTLASSVGAALAALALALLLARRLAARLARLAQGARAVQAGDLTHRIGGGGSDEVAELGASFDRMTTDLERSRAEIESWNRELEARVAARTEELKQAQAQLVEAQKLAALGQLGAGVAHEINNPLGAVIGHVQLLLAGRAKEHPDHEALKCIEEGARRASQVVHNLLRFSVQRKAPVYTSVDLNRVVRETVTLTEALIRDQGVALEVELDAAGPKVHGDAGQLGQVLLNLLANARTATPSGGRIRVRTIGAGGGATVEVEDNGKGIAPEHKTRIFEPFFTTKEDWSNVGLGLSVSFRIVSEHHGKIDFQSEPGRGARFTVFVPSRPPEARAA